MNIIKSNLPIIIAGGGIVKNAEGAYLFIFRKNKWDLPKGKLDPGENIVDCAIREVREETGVNITTCHDLFDTTYHIYKENNTLILKETLWYNMTVADAPILTPQLEEGITELQWIHPSQFDKIIQNTYPSILHLMHLIKTKDIIVEK